MTIVQYDPENWLVSLTRSLASYMESLVDVDTKVEMSFPDTRLWTKALPLEKALIHFEQDSASNPVYGFGVPGDDVIDNTDPTTPTILHREGALRLVNFDVGVWVSSGEGGATKRMELVQLLGDTFGTVMGRKALYDATDGIWVTSFDGGRNHLDRIDDVPVWRALDMTLMVRVVSRHVPAQPDLVTVEFDQNQELTIRVNDGTDKPVVTP